MCWSLYTRNQNNTYQFQIDWSMNVDQRINSIGWVFPSQSWVKLNSDGSFSEDGRAGLGMVLRDGQGLISFFLFDKRQALLSALSSPPSATKPSVARSVQLHSN